MSKIESTKIGLSESSSGYLLKIKSSDKWRDSFLDNDPFTSNVISGFVKTNTSIETLDLTLLTDSTKLLDKIEEVEKDRNIVFEQNRPFIGLNRKIYHMF